MKEELRNILLMGLGAMSMTNDKAQELKQHIINGENINVLFQNVSVQILKKLTRTQKTLNKIFSCQGTCVNTHME